MKTGIIICIVFVIGFSAPASAQLLGDVNCNGWAWEIQDLVLAARFLVEHCELYVPYCWENSDLDGDGRALTVGDIIYMSYLMNPPDFPRHPDADTFAVESAVIHPGETIALPVSISTVDTIMGFQFLLEIDTNYLQLYTLIPDSNFQLSHSDCGGYFYCVTTNLTQNPVIEEPGNYHVCDLILSANPDINQPVTTGLYFSSVPPLALFSGLANSAFFLPVMVDAEIEILPISDIEPVDDPIPTDFSITAYPNPFNDALNISVVSDRETRIMVYDIMGRPVKSFEVNAGNNLINWNAVDENGQSLSAGIYFVGKNQYRSFKKVLYLK